MNHTHDVEYDHKHDAKYNDYDDDDEVPTIVLIILSSDL